LQFSPSLATLFDCSLPFSPLLAAKVSASIIDSDRKIDSQTGGKCEQNATDERGEHFSTISGWMKNVKSEGKCGAGIYPEELISRDLSNPKRAWLYDLQLSFG